MPNLIAFPQSFPYTFPLVFGGVVAVVIGDYEPDPSVAYQEAATIAVMPFFFFQDEPNNQVNPVYHEAWQNQPATLMPVYPSEDLYGPRHAFPSFFFEQEPSYFEGFPEAWQNQATTLMPIYSSEELEGARHLWPYLTMQISRPVFLPDGTGVTSPTKADPVNSGRDDLELAPL